MQSVALNQLSLLNENLYNRKYKKLEKSKNLDAHKKALYSRMMLSYFNIGVQQEHLKRNNDCEISYNRSRALAQIIGDKEIVKRLSKSVNGNNTNNKNANNSSYIQNSANNSKMNINNNFPSQNSTNNFPNFTLYSPEVCEIK